MEQKESTEMQEIKLITDYRKFILDKIDNLQETLDTVTTAFASDLVNSLNEFSLRINSKLKNIEDKFNKNKEELESVRSELKSKQFDESNFNNVSILRNLDKQLKEREIKIQVLECRIKFLEANSNNSNVIKKAPFVTTNEEPVVMDGIEVLDVHDVVLNSKNKSIIRTNEPTTKKISVIKKEQDIRTKEINDEQKQESQQESQQESHHESNIEEDVIVIVKKPRGKTAKIKTEPIVVPEVIVNDAVEPIKKKASKKPIKKPIALEEEDDAPIPVILTTINNTTKSNITVDKVVDKVVDNEDVINRLNDDRKEAEEELLLAEETERQAEEEMRRQEEDAKKKEKDNKSTTISKKTITTSITPTVPSTAPTITKKKSESKSGVKNEVKNEINTEIKKKDSKEKQLLQKEKEKEKEKNKDKDKDKDNGNIEDNKTNSSVKVGYPDKLPELEDLEMVSIGISEYYVDKIHKYVYQILPNEDPGVLLGFHNEEEDKIETIEE